MQRTEETSPHRRSRAGLLRTRNVRTLVSVAIVFLVLGLGNWIFGTIKAQQYQELLIEATSDVSSAADKETTLLPRPLTGLESENAHVRRLLAQFDFYTLVVLGGKTFLALAAALMLSAAIANRPRGES